MHAYIMVGPFREDFSTKEMVQAIKSVDADQFRRANRRRVGDLRTYYFIELKEGEALYLYGGRDAIVKTFADLGDDTSVYSPTRGPMALFRAQRTVASGRKTKHLLMLTDLIRPLSETLKARLVVEAFPNPARSMTFRELLTVVSKLKVQS